MCFKRLCSIKKPKNQRLYKGATKEKWSYAWFTKREAQFLEQKKTITIVPYKNTYGI